VLTLIVDELDEHVADHQELDEREALVCLQSLPNVSKISSP
jgi:hypothetical protein